MKKISVLIALLLVTASAKAAVLLADPAHSSVGFEVKHLMITNVPGQFTDFVGSIENGEKDLTKAKVTFTVKTASINTANKKRDDHLKSDDFFAVEKFPQATFKSDKITKTGANKYKMIGDLTIHGTTKKATFDVTALGKNKDPWGNEKHGFSAISKISRKEYGMGWNKALETGGVLVGDDVKLSVNLQAAEKK